MVRRRERRFVPFASFRVAKSSESFRCRIAIPPGALATPSQMENINRRTLVTTG